MHKTALEPKSVSVWSPPSQQCGHRFVQRAAAKQATFAPQHEAAGNLGRSFRDRLVSTFVLWTSFVATGLTVTFPALARDEASAEPSRADTTVSAVAVAQAGEDTPAEATGDAAEVTAPAPAPAEVNPTPEEEGVPMEGPVETGPPMEAPLETSTQVQTQAPAQDVTTMSPAPAGGELEWPAGWFRMDSDAQGLLLWFGATHDLGGIGLATDIFVDSNDFAAFEIGVEIPAGPLLFLPMAGIGTNWRTRKFNMLIAPQLFTYGDFGPLYFEWWSRAFLASPMQGSDEQNALGEAGDVWYNRVFLLYNVGDFFAIGPQFEATLALNDAAQIDDDGEPQSLTSLPFGGRINVNYGENNTLGLFLGYEMLGYARGAVLGTDDMGNAYFDADQGLVGRFTFIRTW